jgi:hypothetical protein
MIIVKVVIMIFHQRQGKIIIIYTGTGDSLEKGVGGEGGTHAHTHKNLIYMRQCSVSVRFHHPTIL